MPKKTSKVILVAGATGKQGGAVLRHLQAENFAVRALTREPNSPNARAFVGRGTEVVRGDLNDQATLTRALDGCHGAFSVQSREGGVEAEVREGINLADAAKRLRLSHFVYSSVASADQNTGIPHFDSKFRIEEHVRGTGLPYTILRPVFFMENWLGMRDSILEGTIALPLSPDTRLQMIAVDDIGAIATLAFKHPGKWQGRTMELAGDELTMNDAAQRFSTFIGREVRYTQVPWDMFAQKADGEDTVMFRWFEEHGYHADIAAVRAELPSLSTFDRWLRANWQPATHTAR